MDPRFSFRKGYDTDLLILRSLFALDPNTNLPISSFYTPVADGIGGIQWLGLVQYFSAATGITDYVSSIQSFSTTQGLFSNFSTQSYSSFTAIRVFASNLNAESISSGSITTSTLTFLDRKGSSTQQLSFSSGSLYLNNQLFYNPNLIYVSSLTSTIAGLGSAGYISSSQFFSTIDNLGGNGYRYINTSNLGSTLIGLATYGYVSTGQLASTTNGLTTAGFVKDTNLASTVEGLATAGYISSSQLFSTVLGLGGSGLISTGQLTSTVNGLGSIGYISSSQLLSTVIGLQSGFYIVNANNVYINNSRVTISTTGSIIFFSTFMNSSITYQGNIGQITGSNPGGATQPLYFSSATVNLDRWSTYISPTSIVTLEAFPTFLFGNLGIQTANPTPIYMSSFLQGGTNYLSSQIAEASIYPTLYSNGASNSYNQPIKITFPGAAIQSLYPNSMRLAHYLPNAITAGVTQGFSNSNVSIFYGSTNSLFLSIQNLPF